MNMSKEFDALWDYLSEGIATEAELQLITSINGMNTEAPGTGSLPLGAKTTPRIVVSSPGQTGWKGVIDPVSLPPPPPSPSPGPLPSPPSR